MEIYRHARSVYGQEVLIGASWDLLWWFVGAGVAFILVHAVFKAVTGRSGTPA